MQDETKDPRILSGELLEEDFRFDQTLRPASMKEYVGQQKIKDNLSVFIEAAKGRAEALDHVLIHGPPGLGKTTLAHVIAREMEANMKGTSGPAIEKPGDLAAILTNLERHEILFIDEIHRMTRAIEEILYPAIEDFKLDIIIGQGPSARTVKLDVPRFTLIGSTTRASLLSSPLRSRFGIVLRLDYYAEEDLVAIVKRSAGILKVAIDEAGAVEIARRARGTPRIANRLLRRTRDWAQVRADGAIEENVAAAALNAFEVDCFGLDEMDRKILETIIGKFGGGPVGLNTIAAAIGEDKGAIEEIYEPFLIQIGFIQRTPRGRMTTARASEHVGIKPGELQGKLF